MARKQKTLNEVGVIFLSTLAERFSENVWEPEETVFSEPDVYVVRLKIWTSNIQIPRDTYPWNTNPERYRSEKYKSREVQIWEIQILKKAPHPSMTWTGILSHALLSIPLLLQVGTIKLGHCKMIKLAQYSWNNEYITIQLKQSTWSNKVTTIKLGHRFNPFLHRRLQASISTGQ